MNRKGFFFTLDILFAVAIAIIIVLGISYFLQKGQQSQNINLYIEKTASDTLTVLGKTKTLETLDEQNINSSLSSILPTNFAAKLNITVYECEDLDCEDFELKDDKNILITFPENAVENEYVTARRMFISFENTKIKYFSLAELRVWLK